jgi:hypothetical protein
MMMEEGSRGGSAAMRRRPAIVLMVERARNEPDELKNSHETVISAQTPFFTPVLAGQGSSFIKSCSGIKYQVFSADYFISIQLDLNCCISKVMQCSKLCNVE